MFNFNHGSSRYRRRKFCLKDVSAAAHGSFNRICQVAPTCILMLIHDSLLGPCTQVCPPLPETPSRSVHRFLQAYGRDHQTHRKTTLRQDICSSGPHLGLLPSDQKLIAAAVCHRVKSITHKNPNYPIRTARPQWVQGLDGQ